MGGFRFAELLLGSKGQRRWDLGSHGKGGGGLNAIVAAYSLAAAQLSKYLTI